MRKERRQRAKEAHEAALRRKRGAVASLVVASFVVLVAGLWSSGVTGDWKLGAAGIGLAVGVLFFANEMEAS